MARYVADVTVLTPIVGKYPPEMVPYRILCRYGIERKHVPHEEYEKNKKKYHEEDWVALDGILPRVGERINFFSFLSKPMYWILKKNLNVEVKIEEIKVKGADVGYEIFYYGKTKTPVYYECIVPGSRFEVIFSCEEEIEENEITAQIGANRKFGYGKVLIKIKRHND